MPETILSRLDASVVDIVVVIVSAVVIYGVVIAATRVVGLRSFSKLSAFDFAMTVAIGSIIATVGTGNASLVEGTIAVLTLFGAQFSVAWLRKRTDVLGIVDNRPLLLMQGQTVLHPHLRRARITTEDLRGTLRQAGVVDLQEVLAVVLETTGDISVLAGDHLDAALLEGVVGADDPPR